MPCRPEWSEWARQPEEEEEYYKGRVRMTFTFREQDVPAEKRMPDHRGGGRASTPAKTGEACPPGPAHPVPVAAQKYLSLCSSMPQGAGPPRQRPGQHAWQDG